MDAYVESIADAIIANMAQCVDRATAELREWKKHPEAVDCICAAIESLKGALVYFDELCGLYEDVTDTSDVCDAPEKPYSGSWGRIEV